MAKASAVMMSAALLYLALASDASLEEALIAVGVAFLVLCALGALAVASSSAVPVVSLPGRRQAWALLQTGAGTFALATSLVRAAIRGRRLNGRFMKIHDSSVTRRDERAWHIIGISVSPDRYVVLAGQNDLLQHTLTFEPSDTGPGS